MSTPTRPGAAAGPARAVVTGIGVIAPNGLGTKPWWDATLAGESGIRRLTRFEPDQYPATLAGEVLGYQAKDHLPSRLLPQTDHMTRMALTAADWALADAGVDPATQPEYGMGVVTASASGGFEFGQRELEALWSKGPDHVSAYQSFAWFYAVNTGQISIRNGMRGPSGVIVTEQAGGLDALGIARRQIRKGVPLMVSGGVDGSLCPWGWVAQLTTGRLSRATDPTRAFLPFDRDANGYVPGEGGALLIVEDAAAASARGAEPYGEIAGYAATFDPPPGSGRPGNLRRAIELALADAGRTPADIGVVFADGAGTPELDRAEADAITGVFGAGAVPVTVPKTMTGRLYSGGAPLDVAAALLTLRTGQIPPTVNVANPDPDHGLDLVTGTGRATRADAALVIARGHGGFNAAAVLRRYTEEETWLS
uniref:Polyketide chain length factor WhiE-CLF n=1 Tax=uncultured bacterium esnapd17 TaxID=1366598 RepID=S5UBT7_9BACT|nr:polyketide chain length factor WhiE-CLF [uncultured bacterium esnapd17]